MFWNPATMTQFPGKGIEVGASALFTHAVDTPLLGSTFFPFGGTDNVGSDAVVPNSYFTYQFSPNLWLGMAVNAPFGLSTDFPLTWAGRDYAGGNTFLKTYNASPSLAYRLNDWISVGIGAQIQFAKTQLNRAISLAAAPAAFAPATQRGRL